jgi:hypothetical protein
MEQPTVRIRRPSLTNQQIVSPLPPPRTPSPLRFFLPVLVVSMAGAFFAGRVTAPRPAAHIDGDDAAGAGETGADPRAGGDTATSRLAERMRSLQANPGLARSGNGPVGLEAIETLNRLPSSEQREEERVRLIEQWAATAPEAAIDYVRQNLKGERQTSTMTKVVTSWAKHAPVAAWQWARKQGPAQVRQAHTVMEEIGRNTPALAARLAIEFARQEPGEAGAMARTAIRGMTYEGNFDAARGFVAELHLTSPDEQAAVHNYLAGQWARHDPEQAMAWAGTLPEGSLRDQAIAGAGESSVDVNPARAVALADQQAPGQPRQLALQQAISRWSLSDPSAANEWMSHVQPSADFDQALAGLATQRNMQQQHTDLALNWANAIGDPSLKLSTLREVVSDWATRDRDATLNYIQSSPKLSDDTRAALLEHLQVR